MIEQEYIILKCIFNIIIISLKYLYIFLKKKNKIKALSNVNVFLNSNRWCKKLPLLLLFYLLYLG